MLEPSVLKLIDGDHSIWEKEPLKKLAKRGELSAYFHSGFWQPMDTLRDLHQLEELWSKNQAPWKIWN